MKKIFTFLFAALMSVGMFAQLATPVISGDEEFTESTTITITCASAGVDISYSLDGSNPGNGYTYTGPITITETTTVKAQAFNEDGEMSAVAEKTFTKKAGASATTVVTITDSDFPAWGDSFTKDGVTVSAEMIDGMYGNIGGPGSFSTTLGNFTKIEIFAEDVSNLGGEGWSGDSEHKTWTGNASSVSFTGDINGNEEGTTLKFTIEPASTPEPAKYYVVGNMTEWAVDENYEMNLNIYAETEEYFYALDLTTTSEFKVVKVQNGEQSWIPEGMGNNYGQNGEITEDAEYTIYFRPNYDGGEDWFYNCIYVSKNEPQGETITVTWNSYDLPSYGSSFTKDGVTLTCTIDESDLYGPGTFTTDLGNFTKIEVTAYQACIIEATGGWSGNTDQMTWTGNAASVSWDGSIYGFSSDVTIVFTIEPAASAGIGPREELNLGTDYPAGEHYQVLGEFSGPSWIGVGDINNNTITVESLNGEIIDNITLEVYMPLHWTGYSIAATSGEVSGDVASYQDLVITNINATSVTLSRVGEGENGGSVLFSKIIVNEGSTAAIENVQTNHVQAIKFFRDGQLLIEKNGKIYNVQGVEVR